MNYRDTVNLPKTPFPMKANLRQREPELQKLWKQMDLYRRVRDARRGCPKYILHDGPPYASGDLHIGTGLNKILKDVAVRSRTMSGLDAPYVPGWDCHGLPIEHQVLRELGEGALDAPKMDVRRRCRRFAEKHVKAHVQQFQQLGVLGDFDEPYLTLNPEYEQAVIEFFADLVAGGYVYKSLKPIHWDYATRSALAEAELEYKDVKSPAIYVKFPMADDLKDVYPELGTEPLSILIWTTTPWTLPANLAVALAGQAEYSAVRYPDPVTGRTEAVVLAEDLIETVMAKVGVAGYETVGRCRGAKLEGKRYRHILHDKLCPIVLAPYVSLEDGTGCVHTAPGHGREDYETGLKYGLDIFSPVDEGGKLTPESGQFAGLHVFKADPQIVEHLRQQGHLLFAETVTHSYPHGWRSKEPVIFRATEQWFISVDHDGLRQRLLEAIKGVKWIPDWGEGRITAMVSDRPDWCISRQRAWGIPIPGFYCEKDGALLLDAAVVRHVAAIFGKEGSDAWFLRDAADLVPPGTVCPKCGGTAFRKETDIFDVWFESGSSHRAVLRGPKAERQGLRWPADLYLEGTDQHRGWFQLSMLPAVAVDNRPPFSTVVTHGFVVDEKGEKMSKSQGNFISVEDALKEFGSELQRLWTASVDYTNEIPASRGIVKRMEEPYRRFRNTFRYLLGNLGDFDPATQRVAEEEMSSADRWALGRLRALLADAKKAYAEYQFYRVYHRAYQFCTVDMSSFYLDVIKDSLYCDGTDSVQRRATQTVLHAILDSLVRVMAPILVHTCEEVWQAMPWQKPEESVHLALFPWCHDQPNRVAPSNSFEGASKGRTTKTPSNKFEGATPGVDSGDERDLNWDLALRVREDVARELESLRAQKLIGSGLDAEVHLYASGDACRDLQAFEAPPSLSGRGGGRVGPQADPQAQPSPILSLAGRGVKSSTADQGVLARLLIVSQLALHDAEKEAPPADAKPCEGAPGVLFVVRASGQPKCVRCWRLLPSVGHDTEHPELCARCAAVVKGESESERGRAKA